ncbi:MAG: hypothetical protein J6B43_10885, partial [Lachnospiraceae bacterium]|nr:hypothetical protein [Lachnospiraceae bacterium]
MKQNAEVNKLCRGKSDDQKKVIKYLYGGCLTFGKMTDSEYDQLVLSVMNGFNLKKKALDKIGLDEEEL